MVSIVIPTLNEEDHIAKALSNLLEDPVHKEIIVVDGGSEDLTAEIVKGFPEIRFVNAPQKGRAFQMNHGAQLASGNILFFMHADCLLPKGGLSKIVACMQDPQVQGGSFYLQFLEQHRILSFYSRVSRFNHWLLTYGDQGLFMSCELFRCMGGFKPQPIMEDLDMQRRLRKQGKFVKIDAPMVTSARRFLKHGVVKQQLKNALLVLLYVLGCSPDFLAKRY